MKHIQNLKDLTLTISRAKALDQWIYCWLGCIDILVRNGETVSSVMTHLGRNLMSSSAGPPFYTCQKIWILRTMPSGAELTWA